MAPPETKRETVAVAMNLQNGCTEISIQGYLTQSASAVDPLAAVFQRTKREEVQPCRYLSPEEIS
jgi:hypothetical protein